MNLALVSLCGLVGLSVAAQAAAQQTMAPAPDDSIVVTGQHYENKIVCKYEARAGSRFQERICYTNKEWDRMRNEFIQLAHEMIDSPKINGAQ
jgi:hypothetical protein